MGVAPGLVLQLGCQMLPAGVGCLEPGTCPPLGVGPPRERLLGWGQGGAGLAGLCVPG